MGYDGVLSHTMTTLSNQLPISVTGAVSNATVIMSHFVIDTGFPCVNYQAGSAKVPYEFDPNCDCTIEDLTHTQWFTRDDMILHPGLDDYAYYEQVFGISAATRIAGGDYQVEADKLALANNQLNCAILKSSGLPEEMSANNVFISEIFLDQPHLLGVPLISNRLTDPIPLYTHTVMRITTSRESDNVEAIGPTCEVYPFVFPEDLLRDPDQDGTPNFDPNNPPENGIQIDAFEGDGGGNFGWVNWNPGDNSNPYVVEELLNPRLSLYDFTGLNPGTLDPDPANDSLNIGDWISGKTGVGASADVDAILDELENLEGQLIRVPVYDNHTGSGSGKGYEVVHFALIRLDDICLPRNSCPGVSGSDKKISATFIRYDDRACE